MSRDSVAVIVAEMRSVANNYGSPPPLERGASVEIAIWADRLAALTREAAPQASGIDLDALVYRFLGWHLPDSVCADPCASMQGAPHRTGTNLLSAIEAKAMLQHVLGGIAAPAVSVSSVSLPAPYAIGEFGTPLVTMDQLINYGEAIRRLATTDSAIQSQQGATGGAVDDAAVERLAQFIYRKESGKCKTLDAAIYYQSNWRRAIPEAREMLEAAHPQAAGSAPAVSVGDAKDAARYRRLREWFVRGGKRAEIAPEGHVLRTTNEMVDAAIDAALEKERAE